MRRTSPGSSSSHLSTTFSFTLSNDDILYTIICSRLIRLPCRIVFRSAPELTLTFLNGQFCLIESAILLFLKCLAASYRIPLLIPSTFRKDRKISAALLRIQLGIRYGCVQCFPTVVCVRTLVFRGYRRDLSLKTIIYYGPKWSFP
jgi:hypothetical protein